MMKFEFEAIGTTWKIDIEDNLPENKEVVLQKMIMDRIDDFDKNYSRFRKDSLVTKMSEEAGEFILPSDANKMILIYKQMYEITGGLVTPLIGQVLVDAGYDSEYSMNEKSLKSPKKWEEVLKWNNPKLELSSPALLDFGAGGKGYLVDIVSELIEASGIKSYCVDAGGDMRHRNFDKKTLRVGLENPDDTTEVVGVVKVFNESLCGSAGNRRTWGNFHHIINPNDLSSPRNVKSVWCTSETTLLSDMLTTALFFVDASVLLQHFKFEYLVIYSDNSLVKSENFKAEIFIS